MEQNVDTPPRWCAAAERRSSSPRPDMRRRKHWGWGYEDDAWSPDQLRAAAPGLEEHLRIAGGEGGGSGGAEGPGAGERRR
jgi:hypothetical protein